MFSSQIISKNSKRFNEPEVGKGNILKDKSIWKIQIFIKISPCFSVIPGSIETAKESKTLFKNESLDETPEAVKVCFFSMQNFSKAD